MIMFEHFSDNHGNFHFTASDAERVKEYIERELSEELEAELTTKKNSKK